MRHGREEPPSSTGHYYQAIDLISAVKELHGFNSPELNKKIRDSENNTLQIFTEVGSSVQIDVEKLARYLPLHLIAKIMVSERDDALFKYLLRGIRLLHSLCDLAPRHSKLEQILLDDVKVSERLLDLVFYLLIVLSSCRQENCTSSAMALLHSTLVACNLYLLTGCITSQWQDVASVLVAHRKVDIFTDAAFAALCVDIKLLQINLSGQCPDVCMELSFNAEVTLNLLCYQCEASLQFLQSLCQQKSFREWLVKNKELCGKGGVLLLAQAILDLNIAPVFRELSSVLAAVSRLKSKILSILLHLCEAESISYLDVVTCTPRSMDLAKSLALEVLELLKTMVVREPKQLTASAVKNYPTGLLHLNAMRLADIFSDDSNFRSYITSYFTEILTAIFSLPHQEFLSSWCSSDLPIWEEDATLEYDSYVAAGCVLDSVSSPGILNVLSSGSIFVPSNMPRTSYAHQKASLLVKVIANLHCFVPEICKEEKDIFLNKFLDCLQRELPKLSVSDAEIADVVCRNLRSLLSHAESLTPPFLNEDDVQLLRLFCVHLESLITPTEFEVNRVQESKFEGSICGEKLSKHNISEHLQEDQSAGGGSSPLICKVGSDLTSRSGNLKEGTSENSAFKEEDQLYARNSCIDKSGNIVRQYEGEDKSGRVAMGRIDRENQNFETSGSDSSSTRGKNSIDQTHNIEFPNSSVHNKESAFRGIQDDEMVEAVQCEVKLRKKRKRNIMNDKQITLIERALLDEPDMQRNAASLQLWADKLSVHGSEVTTSQLKNWLNNRKARLARAAKDVRAPSEGKNAFPDKQGGPGIASHYDSAESLAEEAYIQSTVRVTHQSGIGETTSRARTKEKEVVLAEFIDIASAGFVQCEPGQLVMLVDGQGEEIGKGKVYQVQGEWYGHNLEELEVRVVDVIELKEEKRMRLPQPCEATGNSFDEAEKKLGLMRVLWDSNSLVMLQPG